MVASIKHATQGMTIQQHRQDQIANNLANTNTTGFKSSALFVQQIERHMSNNHPHHEVLPERILKADETFIDFSQGRTIQTGKPFDFKIMGSGFFTIMTNEGIRYTRDGTFHLDRDGFLVDANGGRVFGEGGFIKIDPTKGPVTVFNDGKLMQDGHEICSFRIADFNKPYRLTRMGNNYYRPLQPDNPVVRSAGFVIKQGYLEGSNVDPITQMVEMISSQRTYDVLAKAIQSEDQLLDRAVNQVGRVG